MESKYKRESGKHLVLIVKEYRVAILLNMYCDLFMEKGEIMKKMSKLLLILFMGIMGGTFLLLLVNALPNERMQRHISESTSVMEAEGDYPMLMNGYISSRLDNFTDSIMLVTAANREDTNLIDRTVNMYRVHYEDKRPSEVLVAYGKGSPDYTVSGYPRYWHGYQVALKPLLLIFNYQEIRYINMCFQILLIAFVVAVMWKKDMKLYILPYLVTVCSLMPVSVALSLQFSAVFYLTNISIILLLVLFESMQATKNTLAFFLSVGMATSYFDMLTYPLVTCGIPLIVYFILKKKHSLQSDILETVQYGSIWAIGYGGMWAGKWIIGSILLKKNIINDALTAIFNRTSSEDYGRKEAILNNLSAMFEPPIKYLFLLSVLILLVSLIIKMAKDKKMYLKNFHYLIIAAIPFAWYMVLVNHSCVHFWFTYRELAIFIFAILVWLCKNLEECKKKGETL